MATLPADICAPSRHRLTVADYRRMGETGIIAAKDRVELIDGEIIDMSPIGMQVGGQNARRVRGFQYHRTGAITKEHAGAPVLEIQDAGENFRPDDECAAGATGFDQRIGNGQRIDKSAANRLHIQGRAADSTELALQNTSCRGKHHVRRGGGNDDEIDIKGRAARRLQSRLAGMQGQITANNTLVCKVAGADAAALDDPVVRCLNTVLRQARHHIGIAEPPRRKIPAGTCNT